MPYKLVFVKYTDCQDVANAIRTLVRGAPAIGVLGARGRKNYGCCFAYFSELFLQVEILFNYRR